MLHPTKIALAILSCAGALQANEPRLRTQRAGDIVYFQIRAETPEAVSIPKTLRQPPDKIAVYELGRQPRLVPQDDRTRTVVWRFSPNAKEVEFLGRCTGKGLAGLLLLVPTEKDGQRSWSEQTLSVDLEKAEVVAPPPARKPGQAPGNDDLAGLWAQAQAREWAVQERLAGDGEFFRFARQSLCQRLGITDPWPRPPVLPPHKSEAARTRDVARLPALEPAEHPWERLLAGKTPAVEGLATFVPHDFYYVRIRNVDEGPAHLQQWLSAALVLLDGHGRDFRLRERYDWQRGFPMNAEGRPRLPNHIREFALIGSDFDFHEGTDATALFVMSNVKKFRGEADESLQALRQQYRITESRTEMSGISVESIETADREISWHRAYVGNIAIFSNSPAAIRRILETHAGQTPALANAPDFRLLRTVFEPQGKTEQVLAYASEAFLRKQFGPARFIQARRRDEAQALLKALQYAALAVRCETGASAADLAMLSKFAGIGSDDPRLLDAKISWDTDHQQVRSPIWNTAAFSTPQLEMPLEKITPEEERDYQSFLDEARTAILPYLAPAGLRVDRDEGRLRLDVFAMPPERATVWQEVRRRVGRGAAERPEPATNVPARLTFSFTSDPTDQAKVQQMLIKAGVDKKYFQKHPDWQGDRFAAQLDDGSALARLAEFLLHADLTAEDLAKSHDQRELRYLLAKLPASLAVEIRRPLVFVGWITQAKKALTESFPNLFTWEMLSGSFRTVKLNRLRLNQAVMLLVFGKLLKPEEAPALWYAYNNRTLLLSLHEAAMKNGVVRELLPRERPRRQFEPVNAALDLNLAASTELRKALESFLVRDSHRQALAAAAVWQPLLRSGLLAPNAPESVRTETALRWFGFVPAAPDRSSFRFDNRTAEVVSARHGSIRQPQLPSEPPKDSPVVRLLEELRLLHADLLIRDDGFLLRLTGER